MMTCTSHSQPSTQRRLFEMRRGGLLLVLLLGWTTCCRQASGVPLDDVPVGTAQLNVEDAEFLGSGAELTYLVVDFRAGGGGSFAFGYRHDGMDTAQDMLEAFDAVGVLDVFLEEFSFGPAVRGIEYPREQQAEVFATAFGGERGWYLWTGGRSGNSVEWSPADVGINGEGFNPDDPITYLPDGGFYGLATAPEFPGNPPLVPIPGDFDSNGIVDGDDLLDALLGFGTGSGPTLAAGDADRDGVVNRADFVLWRENAGARSAMSLAPVSVPEPAASSLLATIASCLVISAVLRVLTYRARRIPLNCHRASGGKKLR